ncbi:TPA: hypothetical protein IGQ72_003076 [Escherichia coli]|nr:hypothetical protein [Escherichia coli]
MKHLNVYVSTALVGPMRLDVWHRLKKSVLLDPAMWAKSVSHLLKIRQVLKAAFVLPPAVCFWTLFVSLIAQVEQPSGALGRLAAAIPNVFALVDPNLALNELAKLLTFSVGISAGLIVFWWVFRVVPFVGHLYREVYDAELARRVRREMNVPGDGTVTLEFPN